MLRVSVRLPLGCRERKVCDVVVGIAVVVGTCVGEYVGILCLHQARVRYVVPQQHVHTGRIGGNAPDAGFLSPFAIRCQILVNCQVDTFLVGIDAQATTVTDLVFLAVDRQVDALVAVNADLPDVPVVVQKHMLAAGHPADGANRRIDDVVVVLCVDE